MAVALKVQNINYNSTGQLGHQDAAVCVPGSLSPLVIRRLGGASRLGLGRLKGAPKVLWTLSGGDPQVFSSKPILPSQASLAQGMAIEDLHIE